MVDWLIESWLVFAVDDGPWDSGLPPRRLQRLSAVHTGGDLRLVSHWGIGDGFRCFEFLWIVSLKTTCF